MLQLLNQQQPGRASPHQAWHSAKIPLLSAHQHTPDPTNSFFGRPRPAAAVAVFYDWDVRDPFPKWSDLQEQTERVRLNFLKTELDVCFTLAAVVETEYRMGNWEHAERTLAKRRMATPLCFD